MIYGIGTDLIRIARIHEAWARRGERFARRILGDDELQLFRKRYARHPDRGLLFLATRFAAKEAVSKAIGLGLRSPMSWRVVECLPNAAGKPCIVVHEPLRSWCLERGITFEVSLTDESDVAMAFVMAQTD